MGDNLRQAAGRRAHAELATSWARGRDAVVDPGWDAARIAAAAKSTPQDLRGLLTHAIRPCGRIKDLLRAAPCRSSSTNPTRESWPGVRVCAGSATGSACARAAWRPAILHPGTRRLVCIQPERISSPATPVLGLLRPHRPGRLGPSRHARSLRRLARCLRIRWSGPAMIMEPGRARPARGPRHEPHCCAALDASSGSKASGRAPHPLRHRPVHVFSYGALIALGRVLLPHLKAKRRRWASSAKTTSGCWSTSSFSAGSSAAGSSSSSNTCVHALDVCGGALHLRKGLSWAPSPA